MAKLAVPEDAIDNVEKLLKGTVAELEKLLNGKNVLGDPIEREGATVIPIVSYGFGFGAGGASGQMGDGGGTGGGGGIRPVGAVVIDAKGARVEAIKGTATTVAEIISDTASAAMARRGKSGKDDGTTET